jgi:hypothetical protein
MVVRKAIPRTIKGDMDLKIEPGNMKCVKAVRVIDPNCFFTTIIEKVFQQI